LTAIKWRSLHVGAALAASTRRLTVSNGRVTKLQSTGKIFKLNTKLLILFIRAHSKLLGLQVFSALMEAVGRQH
jgi:hypothetical protein